MIAILAGCGDGTYNSTACAAAAAAQAGGTAALFADVAAKCAAAACNDVLFDSWPAALKDYSPIT